MKLRLVKQGDFLGIKCDLYEDKHGEVYMTREQIGSALKYASPKRAIQNIHERNSARLNKMSTVLKLGTEAGREVERELFLYTAKGIYEIISLSKQPNARDFMDWVYEVIEAIRTGRISREVLRQAGVADRRNMTDSIRDNIEESPNKKFQYKNFTDLVYKQLFGMNAKQLRELFELDKTEELRDFLDEEQLKSVQKLERNVSSMIEEGMTYAEVKAIIGRKQVVRSLPRRRERPAAEQAN